MLGHMAYRFLSTIEGYDIFHTCNKNSLNSESIKCDISNQTSVEGLLKKIKPDIVVNCIGVLVEESHKDLSKAIYINAYFPQMLKRLCTDLGSKLIHISTDCVFSGKLGSYEENSFRDGDDNYARSKALGEVFDVMHCTLRTSIIGPEIKKGTGLFHWFMSREGQVYGYKNAYWSGVTTLELSKAIYKVIEHDLSGLYHVTNGAKISKYDMLLLFNSLRRMKVEVIPEINLKIDKSLVKSQRFDFQIPSYEDMISNIFFTETLDDFEYDYCY